MLRVGSHGWLEGEGLGPLASLVGWSAGGSGDAEGAADWASAHSTGPRSPVPSPRRPLLPGWQRLPRAWKRSGVSLARRAGFVNKHWGGRGRPRSRWLRSCPPGRSLPFAATRMRGASGAAQCPRPKGHRPMSSREACAGGGGVGCQSVILFIQQRSTV